MKRITKGSLGAAALLASLLASAVGCAPEGVEAEHEEVGEDTSALLTAKTFTAVADAWVDSSRPNTSFGGDAVLRADTSPATLQSYVRFDVPVLAGTIKRAVVRLYVVDETLDAPALHDTSASWSETTLTWNNRPAVTTKRADAGHVLPGTWVEYDVTARVTGQGAYGFALVATSADGVQYASRTTANAPKLVVEIEDGTTAATLACPSGFRNEVFRDDFNGTAVDTAKWQLIDGRAGGGGTFTQLTTMRRDNVRVSGGNLRIASQRHCEDPYDNRSSPEHPAKCSGTNYYSGGWLKTVGNYAPGKGVMIFQAKMPRPVPGSFPALWGRNTEGGTLYTELDLIETSWDSPKGVAMDPNKFSVTTHFGTNAALHAQGPAVGPFANLVTAFHVWEVEWDAYASPAVARYYYRDAPGAARTLLRSVTHESSGFAGKVSATDFAEGLKRGFRPYIDFAVVPDTQWSVGADSASSYDPEDLLVSSVIVCKP